MYKVTYRQREQITRFTVRDTIKSFTAVKYFRPVGVSLVYFYTDRFNVRTVAPEDILFLETI